jgi:hypothetical protein
MAGKLFSRGQSPGTEHLVNSSCQGISLSSVPPPFVERSRIWIATSARLHFSVQQSNKFIAVVLAQEGDVQS